MMACCLLATLSLEALLWRSPLGQVREVMKGLFLPPAMSSLGGVMAGLAVARQNLFPATARRVLPASLPGEDEVDLTVLVSEVGEVGREGAGPEGGPKPNRIGLGGRAGPSPLGSE